MANHVLLDNVSHKNLRVNKIYRMGRGYDLSLTPIFPVEFVAVQSEYPMFFIKNAESGHFDPVAILGLVENENLYLGDDGWDAEYVPLAIERQPFLIGYQEKDDGGVPVKVPVVHIDMDNSSVNEQEGEALFLAHGGESPFLERMSSILMAIDQGHHVNRSFSESLVGLELIESVTLNIEFNEGSKQTVQGLFAVSEEKLNALSANGLEVLHRKGHLRDIYMMLASMPNLQKLIERKNRLLTA